MVIIQIILKYFCKIVALNLKYIDEAIAFAEYERVLEALGCRKMSHDDVVKCLGCCLHSRTPLWFLQLYEFLAAEFHNYTWQLQDLCLFPLSPTRCVHAGSRVFYRLGESSAELLELERELCVNVLCAGATPAEGIPGQSACSDWHLWLKQTHWPVCSCAIMTGRDLSSSFCVERQDSH